MARTLTPKDAHTIMNLLVQEATGQTALTVVDSSTFVSAGETVLGTGIENTLNALSIVIGKTIVAVRPYTAKIALIQEESTGLYTSRLRKISFYDKGAKESGFVNTDAHNRNLYNGYDNNAQGTAPNASLPSMWEQDKPVALEMNFGGSSVWDFEITFYEDQLKAAFRDEEEFIKFWDGIMQQKQNEIEQTKEAFNRMNLLNYMAGVYAMDSKGSKVNLTEAYNTAFGTAYTSAQLRTTYLKSFLEFFVATFKLASDYMTERTAAYHWSPSVTRDGVTYNKILRHTPKADQKVFLYKPLFTQAEAMVMPEIFNPQYLSLENYEGVTYWQSQLNRAAIDVTPAIPNKLDPSAQTAGSEVALDYVVGILFDRDAILTNFQFEGADTTPVEARKKYRNTWYHNMKNAINDFTENAILFYMADPVTDDTDDTDAEPTTNVAPETRTTKSTK